MSTVVRGATLASGNGLQVVAAIACLTIPFSMLGFFNMTEYNKKAELQRRISAKRAKNLQKRLTKDLTKL